LQQQSIYDLNFLTESSDASNFTLEVTTPTNIKNGDTLKLIGKLTYKGEEPIELTYGEPIILFSFTGTEEERENTLVEYFSKIQPGQVIEVVEEFIATKRGKQELVVRTTSLLVNGDFIQGIGNETYAENAQNERIRELQNSTITLEPIMIKVK
jgi:hypothetical protein